MQCLPMLLVSFALLGICLALEQYQPSYLSRHVPIDALGGGPKQLQQFTTHKRGAGEERNSAEDKFSWLKYILSKPHFAGEAQYIPGQKTQPPHLVYDSTISASGPGESANHFMESNAFQSAHKRQSSDILGKRFTDFALPYFKYKRNNGIWIWMPAQGYVSVPKDQQALENAEAAKQGKIMRYGK